MSQRPVFLQRSEINSVGPGIEDQGTMFWATNTMIAYRNGSFRFGVRADAAHNDRITLAFHHLDIALAITTNGIDRSGPVKGGMMARSGRLRAEFATLMCSDVRLQTGNHLDCAETMLNTTSAESLQDIVIKRLSDALAAAENANGHHAEISADALRLAIAARVFCLRSDAQNSVERAAAPIDAYDERQARPLQKWRLRKVIDYVDNHLSRKITLLDMAKVAGLSRMHFAAQFRVATGLRPHEYILGQRIERSKELLLGSTETLVDIALTVGFQTQAHFTTVFKRFVGDTPYQWRSARSAGL